MAILYITGSTETKNSGIIRAGGTIASSLFKLKRNGDTKYDRSPSIWNGMPGTVKAISDGTFGLMTASNFITRRATTDLAGTTSTKMRSGGSETAFRQGIHKSNPFKTTFLSGISWTANRDGAPSYTLTSTTRTLTYSTDAEATVTRSAPGEFTLKTNKPIPQGYDYSAKTGG